MSEKIDHVVIGAGVIGLAIARELAMAEREVVVLEAASTIGSGISSRNSEVIHAGIYYPQHSSKAFHCVRGKQLLYDYCQSNHIEHRRCGKLIVAANAEQQEALKQVYQKGLANGVNDLRLVSKSDVMQLEPELEVHSAIMSPSTGIIDSHGLMTQLHADIERFGSMVVCNSPVQSGELMGGEWHLQLNDQEQSGIRCDRVVNATGLSAVKLARALSTKPSQLPKAAFAKGSYFSLLGKAPFSRLVYPLPEAGGLGVHYTLDLQGRGRFGPDVEWVDRIDYQVDVSKLTAFKHRVAAYWPGVEARELQPDYAGIRPKLMREGQPAEDFVIQNGASFGRPGLFNLLGIESPGLTSCLSIAQEVAQIVMQPITQ